MNDASNRHEELYDFAPMAYMSLDEGAGIREINLAGAALLQHDRESLYGQSFSSFVDASDMARFLTHLRRCSAGQTLSTELGLRIGGSRLDVRLHSAPSRRAGPHGRLCQTAIVDITELRQVQFRLSLSERLATVGTIAAGIAHEINNPLAFLTGSIDLVRSALQAGTLASPEPGRPAPPDRDALVTQILKALADAQLGADRIRDIVKDLGTLARPTEQSSTRVNVQQVLELSVKMAQAELRHRARLVRDYAEVPEVIADSGRLGQVFLNLLVNAAQSIPEGAADRNEIRIRLLASEQTVLVEVRDTGGGIPAHALSRIFDPFFSTKPVGKGMGLGLAISHNLVTELGGTITVESELGQGSTFSVWLPAAAPLPSPPPPEPPERPRPVQRGNILIVDDELNFGQTLRLLLARAHDVTYTPSAREALSRIREGTRYDAILCDLMMAEVTGRQFYELLCQSAPELARRIIFMTGGAYTPASLDFVSRMTSPLITKPFKPEELEKLLAPLLPAV
ncbi:MAG: response regulator [Myxococcaceae bacterium]|nr:response regulator [Myxococcaceae bacterium]